MATVFIPTQMRDSTGGRSQVEVTATTVREAIAVLEAEYPGIRERLCRDDELAPSLQVTIDGILSHRGVRARLSETSELHFLPAIGGG